MSMLGQSASVLVVEQSHRCLEMLYTAFQRLFVVIVRVSTKHVHIKNKSKIPGLIMSKLL